MRAWAATIFLVVLLGAMLLGCQDAPESGDPAFILPTATPLPTAAALSTATSVPTPTMLPIATSLPAATARPVATDLPTATPLSTIAPLPTVTPTALPTSAFPTLNDVPPTDGPIRTDVMSSRDHFPVQLHIGEVEPGGYNTVPPTSGQHWSAWSDCGFYNYPLPDELLVHNLEHGNIIVSYNLSDEGQLSALRDAVAAIPFAAEYAIVRRYHEIPEGMVAITTWGVLDRMMGVDAERIARFFEQFPGNTGPEFPNGLPCTTGVQMTDSSGG